MNAKHDERAVDVAHRFLSAQGSRVKREYSVGPKVPWRAHLFEPSLNRAWYCHDGPPESDRWIDRLRRARQRLPRLQLGLCAPAELLKESEVLLAGDDLGACVLPLSRDPGPGAPFVARDIKASACEFVFEEKLRLPRATARALLDRNLSRAVAERNHQRKGVLLEVVTATLLSQVDGYEVYSRGISNRTQQIDVVVHNRNSAGVLGRGEVVLAEAKNWSNPVGVPELSSLRRKLQTRFGHSSLAFFVTTDRFTSTVGTDLLRDSLASHLIITLDGESLPATWRDSERAITAMIEDAIMRAACL